jgi:hypothetical protein
VEAQQAERHVLALLGGHLGGDRRPDPGGHAVDRPALGERRSERAPPRLEAVAELRPTLQLDTQLTARRREQLLDAQRTAANPESGQTGFARLGQVPSSDGS